MAHSLFGCGCDGIQNIRGIHCSVGHTHLSYNLQVGTVYLGCSKSSYTLTFYSFNSQNEL